MLNDLISTSQTVREKIEAYIFQDCIERKSSYHSFRAYYQERDKHYYREDIPSYGQETSETSYLKKSNRVTVPVVFSQLKSIQASLNSIFTARTPIFQVVASKEFLDEAAVLNNLIERDCRFYHWRTALSNCFLDALKYNICAAEISWYQTKRFVYIATEGAKQRLTETTYSGNKITRLDPYNLFFDSRVPLERLNQDGDFVGYVQFFTFSQFERFWQENKERLYTDSKQDIPQELSNLYYVPPFKLYNPSNTPSTTSQWSSFFDESTKTKKFFDGIELLIIYFRAIPNAFGINIPDRARVQIFKAIFANKKLIHLSLYSSNHNLIPIVFGQPLDSGSSYGAKSVAESIEDIQAVSSNLWNAELEATKKVVTDRIVYNPALINPDHINKLDAARIPLRRVSYNTRPQEAFAQLQYTDPALGARLQQAREIYSFAFNLTGQNPVTQGQFVKGNKTNAQFQESMMASQSRIIDLAISLESTFFQPLKILLLENIFSFVPRQQIFDQESQRTLNVDPEKLRNIAFEFEIADGLFEAQRLVGFQEFFNFFSILASFPDVRLQYDIPGMLAYIAEVSGAKHVKDFKLTPEQQAQMLQTFMAINAAQSIGQSAGQAVLNSQGAPNAQV